MNIDKLGSDVSVRVCPSRTDVVSAAQLRTPRATLRYWRHLGTRPRSFKIGRRVMYHGSDLEAWIADQRDHEPRPGSRVGDG